MLSCPDTYGYLQSVLEVNWHLMAKIEELQSQLALIRSQLRVQRLRFAATLSPKSSKSRTSSEVSSEDQGDAVVHTRPRIPNREFNALLKCKRQHQRSVALQVCPSASNQPQRSVAQVVSPCNSRPVAKSTLRSTPRVKEEKAPVVAQSLPPWKVHGGVQESQSSSSR